MADFTDIIMRDLVKLEGIIPELAQMMGVEATNHFEESFEQEGFDGDSGIEKWKGVKRKDNSSSWYGFKYGSKAKKPSGHPSRKNAKGKYKKRKSSPITNYSQAATKRKILAGAAGELRDSIDFIVMGNTVKVFSDKKYATVQNEGGTIKVFGKKSVKLKARQFMGNSSSLEKKLRIKADLIFKQKTGH